jgi:hypothetical protein
MAKRWRRAAIAAVLVSGLAMAALSPAVAAGDGFAAFWQAFQAAVAKDDRAALAAMVALSDRVDQAEPLSFAKFHSDMLGPAARKCLAKAKAVRDVGASGGVSYSAFCGEVIYGFSRAGGAWKLTDVGAND